MLALYATAAMAAPVEVQLVGVDGRAIGGVVVALRSTDASKPLAKPAPAILDQVDRQFAPHVLVVPVGSPISFPNTDSVNHQVYSFSAAKRFALPLYRGKPYPPVLFDREGVVTIGCNIHDQMRAYVYVVEAQHFGRANVEGSWSSDVVAGEYTLTIWHPLSRTQAPVLEQRVTISATGAKLLMRAATPLKLRNESQVPANWDVY